MEILTRKDWVTAAFWSHHMLCTYALIRIQEEFALFEHYNFCIYGIIWCVCACVFIACADKFKVTHYTHIGKSLLKIYYLMNNLFRGQNEKEKKIMKKQNV